MAGGRPRTVSPPPEECIELGEEMVKWVSENSPTHLSEWYSIEKFIPWKMWNAMCELPEFLPYYEKALNIIARNARDGTLDKSIAQRFLSLYHRDLKQQEREEKAYESSLRQKEIAQASDQEKAKADAIIEQLNVAQEMFLKKQ